MNLDRDQECEKLYEMGQKIKNYCVDTYDYFVSEKKENILFEGAQGVLLDVNFGSYPFVTSSSTSYGAIFTGSSELGNVDEVIGVMKAYITRVGEGPFPTELQGEMGEKLMRVGHEFGATTGRKRRCGWLDLPLLKYASRVGRFTHLALTKVDILKSLESLKVCYAYDLDGSVIDCAYPGLELEKVKPLYRLFEPIKEVFVNDKVSKELESYIHFIERETGLAIKILAYGPDREELLLRG